MKRKKLIWISSSKKDLQTFPDEVQKAMGFGLHLVQIGQKPENAKPLKGFGGADILEILDDDVSGTYRTVYTIRYKEVVYVLHAFQKKSKQGIKTPEREIELIRNRLKQAQIDYEQYLKEMEQE